MLADAGVAAAEVDEVIPVGGATQMPLLRAMLEEMFVGTELCTSVNRDSDYGSDVAASTKRRF